MPPVDSMEPLWHDGERAAVENRMRAAIVGSDATVQRGLDKLGTDTRANEVIVVTDTYEHGDRMDSYQRVSRIAQQSDWAGSRGAGGTNGFGQLLKRK